LGQGQFGLTPGQEGQTQVAATLPGGGLWWGTQATPAETATTTPAAAATPAAATPAAGFKRRRTQQARALPMVETTTPGLLTPGVTGATPLSAAPATIDLAQFLPADLRTTRSPLTKALAGGGWGTQFAL
jgi:hypothetical protein